jgi:hypothetical protein
VNQRLHAFETIAGKDPSPGCAFYTFGEAGAAAGAACAAPEQAWHFVPLRCQLRFTDQGDATTVSATSSQRGSRVNGEAYRIREAHVVRHGEARIAADELGIDR